MSQYDGVIRKTWEVHCRLCERPQLGLRGQKGDAASTLRASGWATRGGIWICHACAPDHPPGVPLFTQTPRSSDR